MKQRHLLAKLTAKGLYISTGAGGGEVYISSSDVAAALGYGGTNCRRLSDEAYQYGRAKYCDDSDNKNNLKIILTNLLDTDNKSLADVLLHEGLWRPIHKRCQGRGCSTCTEGIVKRSLRERAATAGIDRSTYQRNWNRKIERLLTKMDEWDSECLHHLYFQFSDNAMEVNV